MMEPGQIWVWKDDDGTVDYYLLTQRTASINCDDFQLPTERWSGLYLNTGSMEENLTFNPSAPRWENWELLA